MTSKCKFHHIHRKVNWNRSERKRMEVCEDCERENSRRNNIKKQNMNPETYPG